MPWRRLFREWVLYAAIMSAIVVIFMRDRPLIGIIGGLLVSGPLYLLLGFVLAKFGYARKSWGELRAARPAATSSTAGASAATPAGPRPKPAPTRRTGGGAGRPTGSGRRR